jgi:phage/plasmid primase-like uncharacterized protein
MTSNQDSPNEGIEQAIDLSQQILAEVEAGNLEAVSGLYQTRQSIIDHEYSHSAVSVGQTRALLELNQRIERSLTEMQKKIQRAQASASKSARAAKAYQSVAGNRGQS